MSNIEMRLWGKDHWSTFLYCECCATDNKGRLETCRLRTDPKYPTRLRHGVSQPDHTDLDCIEDMENEALLENIGSGINPVVRLTDKGWQLAMKLRMHKAAGGNFATFGDVIFGKEPASVSP